MTDTWTNALVLPGGGARGAYQVGAIQALMDVLPRRQHNFGIVTGTSAGAINACVMASHADDPTHGIERLAHFWSTMHCEHIYRTDWRSVASHVGSWLGAALGLSRPARSLLDNAPLGKLLQTQVKFSRLPTMIGSGHLRALAITASAYGSGKAISYCQSADASVGWTRARRIGIAATISCEHLMASAALPLLFPAQRIGHEYCGDGSIRLTAPLSPAIHLGARRILIIGTRDEVPDPTPNQDVAYPGLGEVGAYLLDVLFMDNLQIDLDRMRRVNETLSLLTEPQASATPLRQITAMLLKPSRDLRDVAAEHAHEMPTSLKVLLNRIGGSGSGRLASYLLFERSYTQSLIRLGYEDTLAKQAALLEFFND